MNPYALLDVFTLDDAVQAITGIVQPNTPDEKKQMALFARILHRDIDSGALNATISKIQVVRQERIGMRRIGINYTQDHRPIVEQPNTVTIIRIARDDLLAWCEARGIRPKLLFPELDSPPPRVDTMDTGSHHTPALDALHAAIRKFWLNYDPARPPKSPEIVGWLMSEYAGLSKTMAESIDRVIRPETYRKGGNIKLS